MARMQSSTQNHTAEFHSKSHDRIHLEAERGRGKKRRMAVLTAVAALEIVPALRLFVPALRWAALAGWLAGWLHCTAQELFFK